MTANRTVARKATASVKKSAPIKAAAPRISTLLRGVLANNPDVEEFTIGQILDSIGTERPEASLVLLSVRHVLPVPGAPEFCGLTAASVGGHFVTGSKTLHLPKAVLQKKISRRSLAVAIHAMLPILEFAEKSVQPRLAFVSHPVCRRAIGILVFILAATIAFPLIGFDPLHAVSIFLMSVGMAEQDGVAILLGAGIGVMSLAFVAGTALKLHQKAGEFAKRAIRRLGLAHLADYLEARGWKRLATILRFDWRNLLLKWNPERAEMQRRERARAAQANEAQGNGTPATAPRKRRAPQAARPAKAAPAPAAARAVHYA